MQSTDPAQPINWSAFFDRLSLFLMLLPLIGVCIGFFAGVSIFAYFPAGLCFFFPTGFVVFMIQVLRRIKKRPVYKLAVFIGLAQILMGIMGWITMLIFTD